MENKLLRALLVGAVAAVAVYRTTGEEPDEAEETEPTMTERLSIGVERLCENISKLNQGDDLATVWMVNKLADIAEKSPAEIKDVVHSYRNR